MNNKLIFSHVLAAATIVALSPAAQAVAVSDPNTITYVTGGIGDEERDALKAVKSDYNLSITSAANSGAYVGDTQVVISDRDGQELVNTSAGPLFYAQLPAGKYVVEGTSEGQMKQKNVTIAEGKPAHIDFTWK